MIHNDRLGVLQFVVDHAELFRDQGSVQVTWRLYQGRRLGPFYRLAYRVAGRQRSKYLGKDQTLAEEVERILHEIQTPLREQRWLARMTRDGRRAFKRHKQDLQRELESLGLYVKGNEIRGWRGIA
jgi:hypothetical protein